jgi:hypothetical protein
MADDHDDDDNNDGAMVLPAASGNSFNHSFEKANDEVMETIERKQKILAKIVCIPGEKTYVADWMQETFNILAEADPDATIVTASGFIIDRRKKFPTGQQFQTDFKPIQSDDTKTIKMVFDLHMSPSLARVKSKFRRLVDYLQKHQIYLEESKSGSNEEVLIGYFMGIRTDKLHLTGFSDDLREMILATNLQPGEIELLDAAHERLGWDRAKPPPFYLKIRNITRQHGKSEFASRAVGIMVATEHASFFKALLNASLRRQTIPRYWTLLQSDPVRSDVLPSDQVAQREDHQDRDSPSTRHHSHGDAPRPQGQARI